MVPRLWQLGSVPRDLSELDWTDRARVCIKVKKVSCPRRTCIVSPLAVPDMRQRVKPEHGTPLRTEFNARYQADRSNKPKRRHVAPSYIFWKPSHV